MENKNDKAAGNSGVERRTLLLGAAWSVPVIAAAATVPLATATTPVITPGVTINPGNGPWTDASRYDGWIADGVTITVADADGKPIANEPVELFLTQDLRDLSDWKRNTTWFVTDPSLSARDSRQRGNQNGSITLYTDANGQIRLDDGAGNGYLRKGSNGEREGQYIVARTTSGEMSYVNLVNSSAAGGTNPGTQPAAG